MALASISENHIVVRILHYDDHYSLLFEDATNLSIPYHLLREPKLGEKISILRSQEYGYVVQICCETQRLRLV